jgi:hypothetical protein
VIRSRYARIFWIGAAGALALAALLAISMLLRGEVSDSDWQTLLTVLVLVVSAGTAVAGLTVAERGKYAVGWTAVAVAGVAFLIIETAIWSAFDDDTLSKLAGTAAFGLVATLLALTQLVLHRGRHAWVVVVTWTAVALAFVSSASALWSENSEDTWKIAASFWIVAAVGWLTPARAPALPRRGVTAWRRARRRRAGWRRARRHAFEGRRRCGPASRRAARPTATRLAVAPSSTL